MPSLHKSLDIYQGYNYKKDKQTPVGFITKMKIGEQDMTADQTCKDPTNPTADIKAVAVLSGIMWELGVTDPVQFAGQITTGNKQNIALLVINNLTNIEVTFQYSVYDYDLVAKKYFLAFHSNNADMKGLVEKLGEDLNVSVSDEPSVEVASPANYAFRIGVKPQPQAQQLHVATGDQKNVVKSWGLAVA